MVDDQVIAAGYPITMVKDLHGCRKITGNILDIIFSEDVLFKQNIVRAEDIKPFGAGMAYFTVTKYHIVATKVACHPRTVTDLAMFERSTGHFFAMILFVG